MKNLALFDLDNTLLAGDSDKTWNQFLIDEGILDAEVSKAANDRFYQQYCDGSLNIDEYLSFALAPLVNFSADELTTLHAKFMANYIRPMMTEKAKALVQKHLASGDLVMIITATNRFVTAPIAAAFDVPHLIATEAEMVDGRYTGKSTGIPSFKEGKITRLEAWFVERGLSWEAFGESWFYSDSMNDLPLLKLVDHPIAVDPDETLNAHAEANGWQVLSLRG